MRGGARRAGTAVLLGVLALLSIGFAARAQSCAAENYASALAAGDLCIAFSVHRGESSAKPDALVIVLHGDLSDGGPADYHRNFAAGLARDVTGIVAVALIRPGYADSEGRRSTGDNNGRRDHYTAPTIDALAGVIRRLAAHVGARRTVLVGHSGGAATAGVMIGRHPGLAQGAVLVACPCDIGTWRRDRGRPAWDRSLSPQDWAARVPPETTVVALTGEKDDNTRPFLAARYVDTLAQRGVGARFQELAGATHNSALRDPAVIAAIRSLVARQ